MSSVGKEWTACRSGEITTMVRSRRAARQRRQIARWSSVATLAVVLVIGGVSLSRLSRSAPVGPLACDQVIRLASQYTGGTLRADLRAAIDRHLAQCPACHKHYEQLHSMARRHPVADPSGRFRDPSDRLRGPSGRLPALAWAQRAGPR